MGNLLSSCDDPDLVDGSDFWAETAMNTENGSVDDGGQDKKVKHLTTGLPDRRVAILLLALFIETVNLCNLTRLVIASNENYPVWVSREEMVVS